MTEEQIRQNAEAYADGFIADAIFKRYLRDTYIAGAHSRDEEVKKLTAINKALRKELKINEWERRNLAEVCSQNADELDQLRNPWVNASKQLPPEDKEGRNLSIDCLVMAGDGNSFFYVIAWYDYSGKCWYEKYDFDQTHLDGNKVFYWIELPKCNHIETEGGGK